MTALELKIQYSIDLIKKAEKLALKYNGKGFHVAFSGGKDSQVIYELCKIAGVKFQAYFYKTSVDAPELLKFIKTNYPDVIWISPKKTMFKLILEKKFLPTRRHRYCCEFIKERNGLNELVIIGIRKEESAKRKKRIEFTSDCKNGCDKLLLSPILNWTTKEVFEFLKYRCIPICSLYKIMNRIGCIGCPMTCNSSSELKANPGIMKAYINTCQKVIDKYPESKFAQNFKSGQDAFDWWLSNMSIKAWIIQRDLQTKIEFE